MNTQRVCCSACSQFKLCQCLPGRCGGQERRVTSDSLASAKLLWRCSRGGERQLTSLHRFCQQRRQTNVHSAQSNQAHITSLRYSTLRSTKTVAVKAQRPQLLNQVAEDTVCYALSTITPVMIKHLQKKRPFATYYDVKIKPCSEAAELR